MAAQDSGFRGLRFFLGEAGGGGGGCTKEHPQIWGGLKGQPSPGILDKARQEASNILAV